MTTRVVVIGSGVAGLATAVACTGAGLDVTVVEQDALDLPSNAADACSAWGRQGVPQLHHSHAFLPRLVVLLRDRAPALLRALLDAGATELRLTDLRPAEMVDFTPDEADVDLTALACRRTTFEWVLHEHADRSPVTARVTGLIADRGRVSGVLTTAGEIDADLVVDTSGARSALPAWLEASDLPSAHDTVTPTGIFYATRFYEADQWPSLHEPLGDDLDYLTYAVYPGDNRAFSISLIAPGDDAALRRLLRDDDTFDRMATRLPHTCEWLAGDGVRPISSVRVMAGLTNRVRTLAPAVEGVVAVGDAAVVSNPLYGSGCTNAFVQAFALADLLADGGPLSTLATPDVRHVQSDTPRLREFLRRGLRRAMRRDPSVWRAALRVANLLDPPDALQQPDVLERVLAAWADPSPIDDRAPTREQLLSAVG